MNLPGAFGTAFAVALLAAACGVASHPARPAGLSSPAGSPRAASMNGPGLVLVSCPSGGSVGPVSGPNTVRVRNLLPHPPGPASDPTLSPDGKRLAFLTGGGKLYVTDLHGTAPKPVATVPPGDGSAVRLLAWK